MKRYLAKNWYLILAGIVLTAFAVPHVYETRGYFAVGGEWLVLPVILMAAYFAKVFMQDILNIFYFEDGDEKCQGLGVRKR